MPVDVSSYGAISGKNIVAIAGGGSYSIALDDAGKVYTWGSSEYGELGNGTSGTEMNYETGDDETAHSTVPVDISSKGAISGKTIVTIAAGYYNGMAIDNAGKVYTWGSNGSGQLGNGESGYDEYGDALISNIPVDVSSYGAISGKTIVAGAMSNGHTLALDDAGKIYTWGSNNSGQLGNNSTTASSVPVDISSYGAISGKTIVAVAPLGQSSSMAMDSEGTVYTWGAGHIGQLGNNSTTNSTVPILASGLSLDAGAAAPADPSSLTATANGETQIDLAWTGDSPKFRVLMKSDTSSTSATDGTIIYEGTDKSYSKTGLTADQAYFFAVYGMNEAGDAFSDNAQKAVASTKIDADGDAEGGWLAGETGEFDAQSDAGIKIEFTTGNSGDVVLNIVKNESDPGEGAGIDPAGVEQLKPRYWTVTATGTADGTYTITLDFTGVITSCDGLTFLKRSDASDTWKDVTTLGGSVNTAACPVVVISGLTGFSEFTVGGPADEALPVELSSFSGASTNAGIVLNWKTASEKDNAGFVISRNGSEVASYQNAAALKGAGTTSSETSYNFVDSDVTLGETYTYKLVSVDFSGERHEYSQTVSVAITEVVESETETKATEYALEQNYPNPFNPSTMIRFSLKQAGTATLKVFDMLGREMFSKQITGSAGWNSYQFNASGLNSGVYFYQIKASGYSETKKMMLLK
ncbi:Fibronectin type III domain protein [Chloroherpeton thalassium ATCC 35110]|uniref:Fibronectin type III domain protein n=1 Tax=Chloroherpeton thalassium (strain ATCC 35110 / GB-78) TaxID=517418 RepID=B3QUU6_CHLT3|nr:Fibronectin type III domain protein [Chloroherpeton thalassium ATCC 35110]